MASLNAWRGRGEDSTNKTSWGKQKLEGGFSDRRKTRGKRGGGIQKKKINPNGAGSFRRQGLGGSGKTLQKNASGNTEKKKKLPKGDTSRWFRTANVTGLYKKKDGT